MKASHRASSVVLWRLFQSSACLMQHRFPQHAALGARSHRHRRSAHLSRGRHSRRWPTGGSIRIRRTRWCWPPARRRAPTPSSASATRRLLKAQGITVELRATQGATENLKLLRDPDSGVDLAFVQGGADPEHRAASDKSDPDAGLVSSRAACSTSRSGCSIEPIRRSRLLKKDELTSIAQLARLASQRGGTRKRCAQPGVSVDRREPRRFRLADPDPQGAGRPRSTELLAGRIDALVFASAPESSAVQSLLRTPGIKLFDFVQADAYSRRFSFMSAVVLPRGVVDLATDNAAARRSSARTDRHHGRQAKARTRR